MLNIKLICVGNLKENYSKEAQAEYLKRLSKYSKVEVIEIKDEKIGTSNISSNEIERIKKIECDKILDRISKLGKCHVISLDLNGKTYDSIQFAEYIQNKSIYSSSCLVFIIGGSLGLNSDVIQNSQDILSFSTFTFPHQLIRIFLLEQLFRAFKILNNEDYHH